jgi:hypothetical protein
MSPVNKNEEWCIEFNGIITIYHSYYEVFGFLNGLEHTDEVRITSYCNGDVVIRYGWMSVEDAYRTCFSQTQMVV